MGGFLYVFRSVAVMEEVSMDIILPVEKLEYVIKPSEPLSKTVRTVVVPAEESMRGMCWKLKAEEVGKSTSVKEEYFPFKRQMMEPSKREIL
jgi:hypothetical protein